MPSVARLALVSGPDKLRFQETVMLIIASVLALTTVAAGTTQPSIEYLDATQQRFLYVQQGWGELGINVSAHAAGQKPLPLQIGDQRYQHGLGHHAAGEIVVDLSGEYERFEADVGLQRLPEGAGSATFRVYVDEALRFDSGVMRPADAARHVSIPLRGATELRLVVGDGGDGITCDCADWADARLVRAADATKDKAAAALEVARFGEVVTCDPARMDGCRATRVQEFRAEDLFLEKPVAPKGEAYPVPQYGKGIGCIGVRWLERRAVREVGIEFASATQRPVAERVAVQCWTGESAWQGGWRPLKGTLQETPAGWRFAIDWGSAPEARGSTRKLRWILQSPGPLEVQSLSAWSSALLETVDLVVQTDPKLASRAGTIELYDGEWIRPAGEANVVSWKPGEATQLKLRAMKTRPWRSERTVLRFRLQAETPATPDLSAGEQTRETAFGVAVDDVMRSGCVYVRDVGLLVARADSGITRDSYLQRIAGKQTILQQVRQMPDQTLAAAMAAIHSPAQDAPPTMLSLACDNHKFVVLRDGTIQFAVSPEQSDGAVVTPPRFAHQVTPRFGTGKGQTLTRRLDGGWLPAPVTEVKEGPVTYQQRTFVVPLDAPSSTQPIWAMHRSLCLAEYRIDNRGPEPTQVALAITLTADTEKNQSAVLHESSAGIAAESGGTLLALARIEPAGLLRTQLDAGTLTLAGSVAPGTSASCTVYIPAWRTTAGEFQPPRGELFAQLGEYWHAVLAPAMQAELPDPLITNLIRASQVHCLMAARNEADGQRVAAWAASINYGPLESEAHSVIRGMDVWGHHEFARRSLGFFIERYAPAGFLTTGYTMMGTGWHLWTLGQHFELAHDADWLKAVAPKVARVCEWVVRQRQGTRALDTPSEILPESGLMPPGVMADWNAFAYYFCLNGYYCAGLRDAGKALAAVGVPGAEKLEKDADAFGKDILRAFRWTQARMPVVPLRDGASVPAYPSQVFGPGPTNQFFPGEDGNRSWCYDVELGAHQLIAQGILPAGGRDADEIMDHMEDVQFLSEGWFDFPAKRSQKDPFNYGGFSKVQPYYCRNGEIYALRDEVKPFIRSHFNSLCSLLNTENLSFQEHFRGVGAWNKTHETGYFLLHSRLMLLTERGDELVLAPFVPQSWLNDGMTISVKNAPTRFGPVSYTIRSLVKSGAIEVNIDPPVRTSPKSILIRLRHPEGKRIVRVDSSAEATIDAPGQCVRVASAQHSIHLRAEY
jgi:hypothetical protein